VVIASGRPTSRAEDIVAATYGQKLWCVNKQEAQEGFLQRVQEHLCVEAVVVACYASKSRYTPLQYVEGADQ
jgi:hypothetical protein